MKRNKERKRNPNRRSKKRKFGSTKDNSDESDINKSDINNDDIDNSYVPIEKPKENEKMKKELKNISNITGVNILKKKGFVTKIFDKLSETAFPQQTEEQSNNSSLKKKFLLWLLDTGTGDHFKKYIAHLIYNGDFLKRMISSSSI